VNLLEMGRVKTKVALINFTGGIPLGLAYLPACIQDQRKRNVLQIIDCGEDNQSHARLVEAIAQDRPDVVGTTVYTYRPNDIINFFKSAKAVLPKTEVS